MPAPTQTLWLTAYDLYLFGEGTHLRAYEKLGAHPGEVEGRSGVHFAAGSGLSVTLLNHST